MKVYISVDIEGVAGITHWDEATKQKPGYTEYRERMTAEAVAACEGALNAGVSQSDGVEEYAFPGLPAYPKGFGIPAGLWIALPGQAGNSLGNYRSQLPQVHLR